MKGALVFLAVFGIFVLLAIAGVSIPPGQAIYNAALPDTVQYTSTYPIGPTNAYALIIGVFNGVIYGFIVWLICTIIWALTKKDKKDNVKVNVVVNNNAPGNTPPPPPQY
jgi:hypothetical protein